ncbi:MAG: zf-TFIIB domain-containing protein [Selenomonadales bacterium]|nr:zf-TFIIB domain-containing protein [Selenomonadales bacterium]
MLCPVCPNVELKMSERKGVEIDYCPKCRGVWLDRGELDKIIELSGPERMERGERQERNERQERGEPRSERFDDDRRDPRRRKSLLGDLFDF